MIHCLIVRLIEADRWIDRLIQCLINWSVGCLKDWLVDWLMEWLLLPPNHIPIPSSSLSHNIGMYVWLYPNSRNDLRHGIGKMPGRSPLEPTTGSSSLIPTRSRKPEIIDLQFPRESESSQAKDPKWTFPSEKSEEQLPKRKMPIETPQSGVSSERPQTKVAKRRLHAGSYQRTDPHLSLFKRAWSSESSSSRAKDPNLNMIPLV